MKTNSFFENKYYNTYYYANIITNVLTRNPDLLGFISNFFADENILFYLAKPFQKKSAFHIFIEHIIGDFFIDDMHEYDSKGFQYYNANKNNRRFLLPLYADYVLDLYGLADDEFDDYLEEDQIITYSDVEEYHSELQISGILQDLFEQIANEIFYIVFNNRKLLLQFNDLVASYMPVSVEDIDEDQIDDFEDLKKLFKSDGYLKRQRIPEWCKKAVFYRDRGKCGFCSCDLSGTLSLTSNKHFDHIVPLAQGGLNDVSNIQLLCSHCNSKKGALHIATSNIYEAWY